MNILDVAEKIESKTASRYEKWQSVEKFCFDRFYDWAFNQSGVNAWFANCDGIAMLAYLCDVLCGWRTIEAANYYQSELDTNVESYLAEVAVGHFKLAPYKQASAKALRRIDALSRETDDSDVKLFVAESKKLTKKYSNDICKRLEQNRK